MAAVVVVLLMAVGGSWQAKSVDDAVIGKPNLMWKSGVWGSCVSLAGVCGDGRRERAVWCSEVHGRIVLEFLCDQQARPPKVKPCFIACNHHRDKVQWQVGAWGPCLKVESVDGVDAKKHEGFGVTQRNVTCVLAAGKTLRVIDEENCYPVARKPDPVRFCNVPQPQDCVVGPFGPWSPCPGCDADDAVQTRVRAVLVAPVNGGQPCPPLTETRRCEPRAECLMTPGEDTGAPKYRLRLGKWQRCQPRTSLDSLGRERDFFHAHAGGGMAGGSSSEAQDGQFVSLPEVGSQTRELTCRDARGLPVDQSLCLTEERSRRLPEQLRACVVPRDCEVSQWTPWTRAREGCVAASGKVRPEEYERKREVLKLSEGEGKPCPHLIERRVMDDKDQLQLCSHKYRWLASKWSACVVTSDVSPGPRLVEVGCGGGVQLRDVTCVDVQGGQPVAPDMCISLVPLPTVQRCEVACPRDCEVGAWGPWGPCRPLDCSQPDSPAVGFRERRRPIEVIASEKGLDCPSVKEVQPCDQSTCSTWQEGQWGPCELGPGLKHCGEGRRSRAVTCRTLYGAIVNDSVCLRRSKKPAVEEPCLLPCPFDCVLSPWSDWSPCSHRCSSDNQEALRQRNRTIIAPPGTGGHDCPNPDEMLQIEACNTHKCHGYSWLALPWQDCHLTSSNRTEVPPVIGPDTQDIYGDDDSSNHTNCGRGVQEREVWCMQDNEMHVPDKHCHPLPKPGISRPCIRPCPIDCEHSPWSDWSPCPQQCIPDASNEVRDAEVAPIQSRRRVIIQWPANGGNPCRNLEELRPCPLSAARCKHYNWGAGPWSECKLPSNLECGTGYRTRAVWCYRNQITTKVEPSFCIEHNNTIPHQSEQCHVDCLWPCVLSNWSPWTPCTIACGTRTRERQLLGLSSSRMSCNNTDLFPLVETESCPCREYDFKILSNWSDCILETDITAMSANGRPAAGMCGTGTRYRRVGCFNKEDTLVEPSLCGADMGLEEEPCFVPCPTDCILSEWSSWGECSALCGPGIHNRTRNVIREVSYAGRPCGELFEIKMCNNPCEVYHWVSGGWAECQLIGADQQRGCGTGDQFRQVRCMKIHTNTLPEEVSDAFCDPIQQPPDVNACHVACPGSCVLSPWSDWSDCSKPCDINRERQRTRSVLRKPAHSAMTCPPLIEVQQCQINVTCFTYAWQTTSFSSCLPLGGSPCGEGIQSRAVYCQRSDGRPVQERFCDEQTRPSPTEKWCYVDCPVDCEVTEWSPWNNSECQCGNSGSTKLRYRYILTNPSPKGRPCPTNLVQHKPCPGVPCYSWKKEPWDSCNLSGAWCGYGTIHRNISCNRDDQPVEKHLCPESSDLSTEDICYVPCRGDCQVSEWSTWSHCHRKCQGPDVGGYQTRSRAILKAPTANGEPCPTQLWETQPCFSGPCLTFDWNLGEDGQLICQRSDGTIALGGCSGRPKPCSNPHCDVVPNSYCDSALGTCVCGKGYQPQFQLNQLSTCIRMIDETQLEKRHPDSEIHRIENEIQSRFYYPKDDEINVWMFAVIGIGCVFIVFVAVSIYLMCHSSLSHSQQQQQLLIVRPSAKA